MKTSSITEFELSNKYPGKVFLQFGQTPEVPKGNLTNVLTANPWTHIGIDMIPKITQDASKATNLTPQLSRASPAITTIIQHTYPESVVEDWEITVVIFNE